MPSQAQSAPHHPALLAALAAELRCEPSAMVDLELVVCDTQPGVIGGAPVGWLTGGTCQCKRD